MAPFSAGRTDLPRAAIIGRAGQRPTALRRGNGRRHCAGAAVAHSLRRTIFGQCRRRWLSRSLRAKDRGRKTGRRAARAPCRLPLARARGAARARRRLRRHRRDRDQGRQRHGRTPDPTRRAHSRSSPDSVSAQSCWDCWLPASPGTALGVYLGRRSVTDAKKPMAPSPASRAPPAGSPTCSSSPSRSRFCCQPVAAEETPQSRQRGYSGGRPVRHSSRWRARS